MIKAIINKEWYKTRKVFAIFLIISLLAAIYAVLRIQRLIALKGMDHLWMIALLKDNSFADIIRLVPLLAGIAIGVAQMVPEMSQKRLKLTLHLPVDQTRLLMLMLGTGIAEILVITGVAVAVIGFYDSMAMPARLTVRIMLSVLPWVVAGFASYLLTCAICLEGSWRRRIILALAGAAFLLTMFLEPALEAYNSFLPMLIIVTVLLALLSAGSVIRFKEGLDN